MTRYARKKGQKTANRRASKRVLKTKKRAKDIDEIQEDIRREESGEGNLTKQPVDVDLPGQGQHYCIQCARYFIDEHSLLDHVKSKNHKKRVRELDDVPYSQSEADKAGGMGCYDVESGSALKRQKKIDVMQVDGKSQ